jgi:hypothetical protein
MPGMERKKTIFAMGAWDMKRRYEQFHYTRTKSLFDARQTLSHRLQS